MGQDKAFLPFLGTTLLERVMMRVEQLGDELFVTTNQPERYRDFGVPLFEDVLPGKGALGGLLTALSSAQYPFLIVVACDMPFVNADILTEAYQRLLSQNADVAVPHTENGYEPFHAVYRRETCLPAIKLALEAGERRLISWFPSVKVVPISDDDLRRYDPIEVAFWNVNTADDLQQAEKFARKFNL